MPTILEMTDMVVPQTVDDVEFYTVEPDTQSFVLFGSTIKGSDQNGVNVPVYIISSVNIEELTLSIQSSSNIVAKIANGSKSKYDFVSISNNNTVVLNNITSNTPIRLTVFYAISNTDIDFGDMEILWSY